MSRSRCWSKLGVDGAVGADGADASRGTGTVGSPPQQQEPLARRARRQRFGGGQAGDRSATDSPLQVVHRAERGRQVDPLPGPAVQSIERGRRMVGADLDTGGPDEDPTLAEVITNCGPHKPDGIVTGRR